MLRYLAGVLFMQLLTLSSDALKVASLSSAKLGAAQKAILTAKKRRPCSCQPMPCYIPDGQECGSYSDGQTYSDASSSIPIVYVDDSDGNRTSLQNKSKKSHVQPMVWGDDGEVYPDVEYLDPEDPSLYPASNIPIVYVKGNRSNKTSGGSNGTNATGANINASNASDLGGSGNGTGNGTQNFPNGTANSSKGTGNSSNGTGNSSNGTGNGTLNSSNSSGLPSPNDSPKSNGSCKPGRRGPPCEDDCDCKDFDGCTGCADSGYCSNGDNVDFDTTLNNLTMIVDGNFNVKKKKKLELPSPGGEQWDTDALFPDYLDTLISNE